jgi:adenylate cyclase
MTLEPAIPPETEALWRMVLTEGHRSKWAFLPSSPRCVGCLEPFGGVGGKLMAMIGHHRSRKSPYLCNLCDDVLPQGGAEVDIAVLFADVRGSTALAERIGAKAFADTLNRFYHVATEVLISHDAMIDKMVGDEVMALFIPSICVNQHRRRAAESAVELIRELGRVRLGDEVLPVGIGVHAGAAFVGKIGAVGVHDFTALGDTVNTAARLQAEAAAGEVVVSEEIYEAAEELFLHTEQRRVTLKGKAEDFALRVYRPEAP